MACAFIIAALKQEAELYISQGLYREAYELYGRFLNQVTTFNPELRRSLEAARQQIKARLDTFQDDENHLLSDLAIKRIKKGWRGASSHKEVLVSTRALRDLGLYGAALVEYRNLLKKKYMTAEVAQGVTDCLVHLIQPFQIPRAIDRFVRGIIKFPKNILMFKILIAKKLDVERYPHHFKALYLHLTQFGDAPADIRKHIQSLDARLKRMASVETEEDAYGPVAGLDDLYSSWTRVDPWLPVDSSE